MNVNRRHLASPPISMLTIEEEKRDKRSICGQFFPITEQIFPIESLHPSFSISSNY